MNIIYSCHDLIPDPHILTEHGRLKAYYQRFKRIEDLTCPRGEGSQVAHHLLHDCKLYNAEITQLRDIATKNGDRWHLNNTQLVIRYFSKFKKFTS